MCDQFHVLVITDKGKTYTAPSKVEVLQTSAAEPWARRSRAVIESDWFLVIVTFVSLVRCPFFSQLDVCRSVDGDRRDPAGQSRAPTFIIIERSGPDCAQTPPTASIVTIIEANSSAVVIVATFSRARVDQPRLLDERLFVECWSVSAGTHVSTCWWLPGWSLRWARRPSVGSRWPQGMSARIDSSTTGRSYRRGGRCTCLSRRNRSRTSAWAEWWSVQS